MFIIPIYLFSEIFPGVSRGPICSSCTRAHSPVWPPLQDSVLLWRRCDMLSISGLWVIYLHTMARNKRRQKAYIQLLTDPPVALWAKLFHSVNYAFEQVVKVITHKAASPPRTDTQYRQVAPMCIPCNNGSLVHMNLPGNDISIGSVDPYFLHGCHAAICQIISTTWS